MCHNAKRGQRWRAARQASQDDSAEQVAAHLPQEHLGIGAQKGFFMTTFASVVAAIAPTWTNIRNRFRQTFLETLP